MLFVSVQAIGAQTRWSYAKGQSVSPAYEGWEPNPDGSFTLYFGYFNTNWQEEFDVPVGPDNNIEPGGPDRGQPTHFYPRRNPFLFSIRVPKDFATTTKELIWTLTTNGRTERVFATLHNDYQVDPQVIQLEVGGDGGSQRTEMRTNKPPVLKVEGDTQRSVKVGAPLTLVAFSNDPDNLPARREPRGGGAGARGAGGARGGSAYSVFTPPGNPAAPSNPPGLRFSWIVYRGKAAAVTFSPEQVKTWQDTRVFANSPWSPGFVVPLPPPDGKWTVQATFQEPGTYVLRGVASDSALFTYENVTVNVTR